MSQVFEDSKVELRSNLTYVEQPTQIIDHKEQALHHRTIPFVKVLRRNHKVEEAT